MRFVDLQCIQHIPMRDGSHNSMSTWQETPQGTFAQIAFSQFSECEHTSPASIAFRSSRSTYVLLQFQKGGLVIDPTSNYSHRRYLHLKCALSIYNVYSIFP